MSREKFATRRATTTINFPYKYPGRLESETVCASFSRLPCGKVGEIWINSINGYEKLVTHDHREESMILSFNLQTDRTTIDGVAKSMMRDTRGRPLTVLGAAIDAIRKEPVDA